MPTSSMVELARRRPGGRSLKQFIEMADARCGLRPEWAWRDHMNPDALGAELIGQVVLLYLARVAFTVDHDGALGIARGRTRVRADAFDLAFEEKLRVLAVGRSEGRELQARGARVDDEKGVRHLGHSAATDMAACRAWA